MPIVLQNNFQRNRTQNASAFKSLNIDKQHYVPRLIMINRKVVRILVYENKTCRVCGNFTYIICEEFGWYRYKHAFDVQEKIIGNERKLRHSFSYFKLGKQENSFFVYLFTQSTSTKYNTFQSDQKSPRLKSALDLNITICNKYLISQFLISGFLVPDGIGEYFIPFALTFH